VKDLIAKTIAETAQELPNAANILELQLLRSRILGKKSAFSALLAAMGKMPKEERPVAGKLVNEAKVELEKMFQTREDELRESEYARSLSAESIDITMPGRKPRRGSLHPVTMITREVEDIFIGMGFDIAEGPDIEDEYHNFDALNTPKDHPSRNLTDTFFIANDRFPDVVLRTQTSSVQIRSMENHRPPIKLIAPGRCFRNDNDASHSPAFTQFEALVVDEGISFADLRDMLNEFTRRMFGDNIGSRIRPHFFPFTEPSAEIDIACVKCGGTGCNVCKNSGWLEMGGAGMVDPAVFAVCGIDPERFTGYAFGLGLERIAMLKYNIPDMRMLFDNEVAFLSQFRNLG
jgi:phenylalanyl-tRNA synthetase alpha chain